MAGAVSPLALSESPIVGRERERAFLQEALRAAQEGRGCAATLSGPGGIGKTRLLRWLEGEARERGFQVGWGYCLKESLEPYFPIEQLFVGLGTSGRVGPDPSASFGGEGSSSVLLVEEERPSVVYTTAARLCRALPTLLLSRDRGAVLRQRFPDLEKARGLLWLARAASEDALDVRSLDALGDRLEAHLREHPGALVVVAGVDYLVSQAGFAACLRLVQYLRDVAEETGGHLLLGFHPVALEVRQLSLLEAEGEVYRATPTRSEPRPAQVVQAARSPSQRLLDYTETLTVASSETPCLLLLDDLQWADPQSRLAFQFLARNLRGQRVLLVASVREEEDPEADTGVSLLDLFERLEREGFLHRLPLRGLDEQGSRALAEGALGGKLAGGGADRAFLDFLQRAGGNPYFVLETARGLVSEGAVVRAPDGGVRLHGHLAPGDPGALPDTIRRMVVHRLASLDGAERRLVHVASVLGSEFDVAPLTEVLGRSEAEVTDICRRLERRLRLVHPVGEGASKWSFAHPMTWEAVLAEIPSEETGAICKALGGWYATHRPQETAVLARLWHEVGDPEHGLPIVRRALRDALGQQAGETIVRYHVWLQDLLRTAHVPTAKRVEEGLGLVDELWMQGSFSPASALLTSLDGLGPDLGSRWAIARARVDLLVQQNVNEAQGLLRQTWAEMDHAPDQLVPELRARWLLTRARVKLGSGGEDGTGAEQDSEQALRLFGEDGPASERCRAYYNICYQRIEGRRTVEAMEPLRRGLELARRAGLPLYEADFLSLLAWAEPQLGDYRNCLSNSARCVEIYRRNGGAQWLAIAMANYARALENQGDGEAAMAQASEALELSRRFDLPRLLALSLLLSGELRANAGRWEDALPFLERAEEMNERLGFKDRTMVSEIYLSACRGHLGSPEEGIRGLRRACEKEDHLELERRIHLHLLLAGLLELTADLPGVRKELELALAGVRGQGIAHMEREALLRFSRFEREHGSAEEARRMEERAEELGRVVRGGVVANPSVTSAASGPSA